MKPNAIPNAAVEAADEPITTPVVDAAPAAVAPTPAAAAPAEDAVALVRAEAAALATIGAQAARLGLSIDVADAVQKGITPDAMRASVLNQLAARGDASAVAVVPTARSATPESPIMAAAKRAASAGKAA